MYLAFAICWLAAAVVSISAIGTRDAAVINAEVAEIYKECKAELKIPDEILKELNSTADKSTFNPTDDLKCLTKCVSDKIGLFVDGKLNMDRIIEVHVASGTEESKIREYVQLCKDQFAAHQDCNSSWELYTCFFSKL